MNNAYSDLIIEQEFESLFTDIKKTDLKPDAFTLLKTIIKNSITDEATKTNDPAYKASFVSKVPKIKRGSCRVHATLPESAHCRQ